MPRARKVSKKQAEVAARAMESRMSKPDLRDPDQWIPRELFAAYCGARSDKLLAYYDKAKAKRQLIVTDFDWLAFLLLPAWFGYRRQWNLWGTLTGMLVVATLLELLLHIRLPSGALAGSAMALGLMAHGILLANANGAYLKLKASGASDDAIRAALTDRASPSPRAAALALMGSLAIGVALGLLLPDV
jgi:hypothetical protein